MGPVTVRVSAVEVEGGDVSYADPARGVALAVAKVDVRATPAGGGLDVRLQAGRLWLTRAAAAYELDDLAATAALRHDRSGARTPRRLRPSSPSRHCRSQMVA